MWGFCKNQYLETMFKLLGTINATKSNKNPTSLITYQQDLILFYTYKKKFRFQSQTKNPQTIEALSMPSSGLTTHCGDAYVLEHTSSELECCEKGYTYSVWLENESILMKLPKVSEVATNHWIFSKVWLVTWLYLILLPILG